MMAGGCGARLLAVLARLLTVLARLLPVGRRELARALLAEAAVMAPGRKKTAWIAGGLWFVTKESLMRVTGYPFGLLAAAAAVILVDRLGSSDDSSQVSLLVLLAGAGLLGYAAPRRAWLAGLVPGAALAAANLVYAAFGQSRTHPAGIAGAVTLLVLIIPAMAAAYLGAGAARLPRRAR